MIKIFGATDTVFTSNGDCVLQPLKAKIHKEDNGDYYLDLETSIKYVDYFVENNIVIANTPQGEQAFRIGNVQKTRYKLSSKCYHVYYDSKRYLIVDSNVENKTCQQALAQLNGATEPTSEFSVSSNVTGVNNYACVRQSLYDAFSNVLSAWGGHLVRDFWNVQIESSIGTDNGITIRYKKNLQNITCQEDWSSVVTKLLPTGKDDIMLNELNPSASIYVTSSTQYSVPYTKTVAFSQDLNQDDYPDETAYKQALINDLRTQAENYIAVNCLPQVNYTLNANIDTTTDVGDVVEVIDERLGIDLLTNVILYEYDCILEKYTQVEFGNFQKSLSGLFNNIINSVNKTINNNTPAPTPTPTVQSVITASLNSDMSGFTADTDTQIVFDSYEINGDKLSLSSGAVVIGSGVSQVLISATATVNTTLGGTRSIKAIKNFRTTNTLLVWSQSNIEASTTGALAITSTLVSVQEGDTISLWYNTPDADDVVVSSDLATVLTIEVVS